MLVAHAVPKYFPSFLGFRALVPMSGGRFICILDVAFDAPQEALLPTTLRVPSLPLYSVVSVRASFHSLT
jgi:hypothetical protein